MAVVRELVYDEPRRYAARDKLTHNRNKQNEKSDLNAERNGVRR